VWALGTVASVVVVGAYSRALVVPQRLQAVSMRTTEVLYPTLVGRHTKGDGHGFDRALIDSIRYEMAGMLLIAAAIGGAAHSVLEVFGPGFSQATPALALLIIFPALASVTVTQTQALWAANRPGRTSWIAGARLAVTLLLLVILTPRIGIVGAAIATLAGFVCVIILSGIALRSFLTRPLRATWPLRERLAMVAAYAAGFAAARLVEQALPSIAGLPVCLLAGSVAYAVVFLALGGLNGRDRHRLAEGIEMGRSWRERRRTSKLAKVQSFPQADGRVEHTDLAGMTPAGSPTIASASPRTSAPKEALPPPIVEDPVN
jgi:O-antigen/teichoic acid export membrane protein